MTVKLDKKVGVGNLSCKVCGQRFQTGINCEKLLHPSRATYSLLTTTADLSAAVDVYSDWVDACDAVAKTTASKYEQGERNTSGGPAVDDNREANAGYDDEFE